MIKVNLNNFKIANDLPFVLIAGPCVIESEDNALMIAEKIKKICYALKIDFIYKSSFDKANRSSIDSARGTNLDDAIKIFEKIKKQFDCPILTDVHTSEQCDILSENDVVDIIQIPAFLCRQTDLLLAAGKTNKIINVKKGQFLAPDDVIHIYKKIETTKNKNILITERGTSFGYNNLVNDFRALDIMKKFKYPIIYDGTHSVQQPGLFGKSSGGKREFIPSLCRAAVSIGVAGIFLETHNDPDNALSDGPNMLNLKDLKSLLINLIELDTVAKKNA